MGDLAVKRRCLGFVLFVYMLLSHEKMVSCRNIDRGIFFLLYAPSKHLFHIIVFINVDSDNAMTEFHCFNYLCIFIVSSQ